MNPRRYEEADFRKLLLILGVLTIHSFPEGVAVGVAFADLGLEGGLSVFGVAVSIPLRSVGVSNWRLVWWSVFSSLPQPVGAVVVFSFVRVAREFLPAGFGFAAGAMVYLVLTEFVPEALERGTDLPNGGRSELLAGVVAGVVVMVPLLFV